VVVHPTLRKLRKAAHINNNQDAAFLWKEPLRPAGCVGEVHLAASRLGPKRVAHEICHAAWVYCFRRNRPSFREIEERMAYSVGNMTSEFYRKAYKAGIIKEVQV
jgi:hypothetical protein